MLNIILNETELAQGIIQNRSFGKDVYKGLVAISKYYIHTLKYDKNTVNKQLEIILNIIPNKIKVKDYAKVIDDAVKTALKNEPIQIDYIGVTQKEIDYITKLSKPRLQCLSFALLCLAKYGNAINPNNNNWCRYKSSDILKLANISAGMKERSEMLRELRDAEYISFGKRVDSLSLNVLFVDDGDEAVLSIDDFRSLGYQYLMYLGKPFMKCERCGITTKRENNRQRYCKECTVEVNKQKTLENYYKKARSKDKIKE